MALLSRNLTVSDAYKDEIMNKKFLSYWYTESDPKRRERRVLRRDWYTRKELFDYALHSKYFLEDHLSSVLGKDLLHGVRIVHYMTANRIEDVIFRITSTISGYVIVTVNWQADSIERILYKIEKTNAVAIIVDSCIEESNLEAFKKEMKSSPAMENVKLFSTFDMGLQFAKLTPSSPESSKLLPIPNSNCPDYLKLHEKNKNGFFSTEKDSSKSNIINSSIGGFYKPHVEHMIIFTSGTTSFPKGVRLGYENFDTCRKALESFLETRFCKQISLLVVNPLHHMNSSALCFWALKDPRVEFNLVEKYTTFYWSLLTTIAGDIDALEENISGRSSEYTVKVIAPLLSRHFDFLDRLIVNNGLSEYVELSKLSDMVSKENVILPIGSSPVGKTTVELFRKIFKGKIPITRFGSTETCSQVCATPLMLNENELWSAYLKGWEHVYQGKLQIGYFIGRDHPPYTTMKIVRSVVASHCDYMLMCVEGEPGYIVCKGKNLMLGYISDSIVSPISDDNWYLGLGDMGFFLIHKDHGVSKGIDFYWQERTYGIIIKGGTNFSCEQINLDITSFLIKKYRLLRDDFEVRSVGLKLDSSHEDLCCVLIQLNNEEARSEIRDIEETLSNTLNSYVGCKVDYASIGNLPKNFKGEVSLVELRSHFKFLLQNGQNRLPTDTTGGSVVTLKSSEYLFE